LVASSPYPYFAWPLIVTTREALIMGAGSKYVFSPNLMVLDEIAVREDLHSVALVGLGCQIQALRKLQLMGDPCSRLVKKVKYAFGLYCGAPMVSHQDLMEYVAGLCEVPPADIASIDFRRVSMKFDVTYSVILRDGSKAEKRMNLMDVLKLLRHYQTWNRCRLCTDYSADYADISFGGTHVTSRTAAGEELAQRVLAEGYLVAAPPSALMDGISAQVDRNMGRIKKVKNRKRIADYKEKGEPVPNYDRFGNNLTKKKDRL
jgi:coenzyme F420 hydrogenase subunit beta